MMTQRQRTQQAHQGLPVGAMLPRVETTAVSKVKGQAFFFPVQSRHD